MIAYLDKQMAVINASIKKMIDANPDWSEKDKIIQSVPGVGEKSSQALITGLSELGALNRREVAALVGTAPRCQDSGKKLGARRIRGGRTYVRAALYTVDGMKLYFANFALLCVFAVKFFFLPQSSQGNAQRTQRKRPISPRLQYIWRL